MSIIVANTVLSDTVVTNATPVNTIYANIVLNTNLSIFTWVWQYRYYIANNADV